MKKIKIDKKAKMLSDIASCYDEIYNLERDRVFLNKKIQTKKARMNALLNSVRIDYGVK